MEGSDGFWIQLGGLTWLRRVRPHEEDFWYGKMTLALAIVTQIRAYSQFGDLSMLLSDHLPVVSALEQVLIDQGLYDEANLVYDEIYVARGAGPVRVDADSAPGSLVSGGIPPSLVERCAPSPDPSCGGEEQAT